MDDFRDANNVVDVLGDWTRARGPLYHRLAGALTRVIREGELPPGERMPSERDLARMLAVSRATVVAAYDKLRDDGLVNSLRGSGTRVSALPRPRSSAADGRVPGGRATSIFQRIVDGPGELISLAYTGEPAAPELGDFLQDLVREELPSLLTDLGYHPRGLPSLRQAIAAHYTGLQLPTTPDQVLITTGAQQVVGLVAQMYLRPGCTVVVESPGWPGCLDVFRASGARLVGVPLDDEGIRPDELARVFVERQPALAYVMPTYHNPTGTLMSTSRRRRIAELATRFGVPLLEDNALMSAASGPPVSAYAPASAEVLTIGSLSQSVWAGLRIGWVRGPGEIIERLVRYKARADLGSPVLDQALAARLLPDIEEIARSRAAALRLRIDHLQQLLTTQLPRWRWRTPDCGSALWVELPDTNARIFAQIALRHGVEVVPGSAADPSGGHDNYLRLPATFPMEVLTELVDRLRLAWTDLQRLSSASRIPRPIRPRRDALPALP